MKQKKHLFSPQSKPPMTQIPDGCPETQKNASGFFKKLLSLVFPIAFQQFMLALVSASDAFMLGALSQDSLSAVSLASQVTFVENLFFAAMTIGLSMLAAQYWGKGDRESVERIFGYVLKITTAISFLFFLAGLCFPKGMMHIFTNDPELVKRGAVYLRTVSSSFLLAGISQTYLCILKNSGWAARASFISAVSVLVNILLNAVLIFGLSGFPKLEIAGAALATVSARLLEVLWCVLETLRADSIKLRRKNLIQRDRKLCRDFWHYTAPVLGNEIVWGVGFTMYSVIMGHLGSDAVAANSIANIAKNLIACFCLGVASGGGILVGNELGAGNLQAAREYGGKLCRLALVTGAASGLLLLSLSPLIVSLAGLSERSSYYLQCMFFILPFNLIGYAVNSATVAGIFCSGGDSKFGFCCDTIIMWCITVPLGLAAAFLLKLPVIWVFLLVNLDELLKLPAVYRHYRKYQWVKNLTETV